jgi:hypothetical protein
MTAPLALTDEQFDALMRAAKPLAAQDREPFLHNGSWPTSTSVRGLRSYALALLPLRHLLEHLGRADLWVHFDSFCILSTARL